MKTISFPFVIWIFLLWSNAYSTSFHNLACSLDPKIKCLGVYPLHQINKSDKFIPLPEADDALSFRIKSIRAAKKSIYIQTFLFKNDQVGRLIVSELIKKKNEGVDVRLVLDSFGVILNGEVLINELKNRGIEVRTGDGPVSSLLGNTFGNNPGWGNSFFHTKLWVVDSETSEGMAIFGGRNIGNEYFRVTENKSEDIVNLWTDFDIAVFGQVVKDAANLFFRNLNYFRYLEEQGHFLAGRDIWNNSARELLPTPSRNTSEIEKVELSLERLKDKNIKEGNLNLEYIARTIAEKDLVLKEFSQTEGEWRMIQSRPRLQEFSIFESYLKMIQNAKKEIILVSAYFVPEDQLLKALRDAVKRGVKVHLMTNSHTSTDIFLIPDVGRYYYNQLLSVNYDSSAVENEGEFRVYEWLGSRAKEGCLHSKWACADGEECIIGSFNLNQRSLRFDAEVVLAIKNKNVAQNLTHYFFTKLLKFDENKMTHDLVEDMTPLQGEAFYRPPFLKEIKIQLEKLLKIHL